MKQHRFLLEPFKGKSSRHICPNCGEKGNTFTLYIDNLTNEYIDLNVGRCSRENNCGYHYSPKHFFTDNNISEQGEWQQFDLPKVISTPETSFIPVEQFKASLKCYEANNFIQFLLSHFGKEVTTKLIEQYYIGTAKYWQGATVFWQIDITGRIRTGKIMQYSPVTGKRIKEPFNHIQWAHKALKYTEYGLRQCLFGEHLLKDTSKPVAIVESEKTAIIASAYLPEYLWLASGSLNNLSADKCEVLKGRKVVLFPDLKAFDKWTEKAKELSHITSFSVSDLVELNASEEEIGMGWDIADYLLKLN